jgi:N-formylglutamate deformylase
MDAENPVFKLRQGTAPLLVSMPHVGTHLPAWLQARLTPAARAVPDTDWHLESLYDFLGELDVTLLAATHTRYVIDLNRPADDASLYPGQSVTTLCPVDDFDEQPIYLSGRAPAAAEIAQRIRSYWQPYHTTLRDELERLRQLHGSVLLWDAHSIRSRVPRFFDGELPNFNFGTADHQSCTPALAERLAQVVERDGRYSWVMNGRFKGGYITRHYGNPHSGIHAIQLEMAMRTYMRETQPYRYEAQEAQPARDLLRAMIEELLHRLPSI